MKFILTNDDGIDAPGIKTMENALARFGDVVVIAPKEHLSGISHKVTMHAPIPVEKIDDRRFMVDGTPADCVRLGLTDIAKDASWVFSGINCGANLGSDIYASGTVAAAREAVFLKTPSMAFSQYIAQNSKPDWDSTGRVVQGLIESLMKNSPESGFFLNVNLPYVNGYGLQPEIKFCPPDKTPYDISYRRENGGMMLVGDIHSRPRKKGCDIDVCFSGYVAVSKIGLYGEQVCVSC